MHDHDWFRRRLISCLNAARKAYSSELKTRGNNIMRTINEEA